MGDSFHLVVKAPHEVREIDAVWRAGMTLSDVLRQAELPLNTRCGQRGLCDGCLVRILEGQVVDLSGGPLATDPGAPIRACRCQVPPAGVVSLQIPARSLLAHAPQVVSSFRVGVSQAHHPLWQSWELPAEAWRTESSLLGAVGTALAWRADRDPPLSSEGVGGPGERPREGSGRVVLEHRGDHWSVRPAPRNLAIRPLGLAVDVGTTTVVVLLVDLADGQVLQTASALSAQTRLGDNVVTRIQLCLQDTQLVARLQQQLVRRTLRPLLEQVLRAAGAVEEQIVCLTVAGNTTMLHLLAGENPGPLGIAPFTPAFLEHRVLDGGELLADHGRAGMVPSRAAGTRGPGGEEPSAALRRPPAVHLLPGAAAYVGADIVAGMVAAGMIYRDQPCLLVDIGTNGELVLQHGGRMWGCATAAGPAFEGFGLRNGVRAVAGAISHIGLNPNGYEPDLEIIGKRSPIGICGTAYVDFLAAGCRSGLLGRHGRFLPQDGQVPRLVTRSETRGFDLARTEDGQMLQITEADVASLLQAKAAIAAGIACLMRRAGLAPPDIPTVLVAGGFGFHMTPASVVGCGLLPGFRVEQIDLVGNTSLAGAYLALIDSGALREMKRIGENLEIIELNQEPDFETQYIDQLALPALEPS